MKLELDGKSLRIAPIADVYPEGWFLETEEIEISAAGMCARVGAQICLHEQLCIQVIVSGGDYGDIGHPHNLRHEHGVVTYQVIATMGLDPTGRIVVTKVGSLVQQIDGKSLLFDHQDEWWALGRKIESLWASELHALIERNPDFMRDLWSIVRGIIAEDMTAFIAEGDPTGSKTRYRDFVAIMPYLPGVGLKQIWGQLNGFDEFQDEVSSTGYAYHTGRVPWQCKAVRRKGMALPSWP